ncbi:MAG: tetratricopeptide repeat protein [candidate division Zixibacteria bacterium]|nr:tetratricopeptide repeat protein [candidate division Zixibacteria bacterium]
METYRLNSRVASTDREYLIQTVNDTTNHQIRSSIFAEGQLLETIEENVYPHLPEQELLELVKNAHKERKEEVEHIFERYKEALTSNEPEQIDYLALALMYKKMYNEAEVLFRRAVSLKPGGHEQQSHLGQVLMMQRKYAEAVEVFDQCVQAQPKFADYRNHLGEAFLAAGSCKRAMIEFDEAIAINIYYGDAYYNKALTYILNSIRREDFKLFSEAAEKIAENLDRAIVVCPEYQDKSFEDGKKLLADGDLEGAYTKLVLAREHKKEQRFREFSSVYLKFMLVTDKIDEKTLRRRIENLKDAIAKNPHFPDLHYDLAVAYTLMGRFIHSKAIREYQEALKINPDFDRAKKSLRLAENEFRGFDVLVKAILKG